MTVFLTELATAFVKYIFLIAVAVAGVFAGIALRKRKDQKEQ